MKILIIGSSGFVGRNLYEDLRHAFEVYGSYRVKPLRNQNAIVFDFNNTETWENLAVLNPDVIINAAGYGVVKLEQDLSTMYQINYLSPASFFDYVQKNLRCRLIQIGSAFEYDLSLERLTESSPCRPRTHYGISKYMMSQYLLNSQSDNYTIIRPFGMFGPYEHESKFFPFLIMAQRDRKEVDLSSGEQVRDYIFVKDLSSFISQLLEKLESTPKVINIGTNQDLSVKDLAQRMSECLPRFEPKLWQWGVVKPRMNESAIFINQSDLGKRLGLKLTDYNTAFNSTINYYFNGSCTAEI